MQCNVEGCNVCNVTTDQEKWEVNGLKVIVCYENIKLEDTSRTEWESRDGSEQGT